MSGIGERIREMRKWRGLTLDALAAKCGIAKPNLSRLENDKVTPKLDTIKAVATALGIHPALLIQKCDWTHTHFEFRKWMLGLFRDKDHPDSSHESVGLAKMVKVFLARWPEHGNARRKLLRHTDSAPP